MGAAAYPPGRFSSGILQVDRYWGIRAAGIVGAVLVHAAMLPMLIEGESVPAAQSPQAAPVMVDLISTAQPRTDAPQAVPKPAEPIKPKAEKTLKPKAKPKQAQRPVKRSPILSTPSEAAVQRATAEQALSPHQVPTETAPAPVPPPAPVIPPRFNANYLRNPPPAYPVLSRRQREQGKVVLRVLVSAGGGAERVDIRTSSGFDRLDAAALEAVKQWKFVPARQGDQPVPAWVLVPISFSLEG
ncbi:energy transducer TonB [Methylocaldum sp.]|uniref:energy transducer TonB n=1 Tax=Methylocaldum sp. TaxID=1969727 RepID=UPI002D226F1E|nr:energy transducer TonB [Methylocaldum sp.]HYE37405.1 energy transducer TonB [Methylocaldum sp.]